MYYLLLKYNSQSKQKLISINPFHHAYKWFRIIAGSFFIFLPQDFANAQDRAERHDF